MFSKIDKRPLINSGQQCPAYYKIEIKHMQNPEIFLYNQLKSLNINFIYAIKKQSKSINGGMPNGF